MILRTALRYLALFAFVLVVLAIAAYAFVASEYRALLAPALNTPEGTAGLASATNGVAWTLTAICVPIVIVFAGLSWMLARASLQPLLDAQKRERIFAADAAHALRTPLATIAAIAQRKRCESDDDWSAVERAALDASGTVGELLTLARGAGRTALLCEPADIGAVVRDTVREFEPSAATQALHLTCDAASVVANVDERRIRELVRNLLENALHHARSTVAVTVRRSGTDAEIVVWNDGDPIDETIRPHLFERFFRGTNRAEGTGLGLAIVDWIAQAHGGHAAAPPGVDGACFRVTLPAVAG